MGQAVDILWIINSAVVWRIANLYAKWSCVCYAPPMVDSIKQCCDLLVHLPVQCPWLNHGCSLRPWIGYCRLKSNQLVSVAVPDVAIQSLELVKWQRSQRCFRSMAMPSTRPNWQHLLGMSPCTALGGTYRLTAVWVMQGDHWSWKVMEFRKAIFQAWKVMENDAMISRIFTTALSNSIKVTQMNRNVNTICRVLLVYFCSACYSSPEKPLMVFSMAQADPGHFCWKDWCSLVPGHLYLNSALD